MNNSMIRTLGILVAIVLVVGGFWWWASSTSMNISWLPFVGKKAVQETATTTEQVATTTTGVRVSRSNSDVASIVSTIPEASRFATLFVSSGVRTEVSGKGPYTIFVPTNGAFSQLSPGTLDGMNTAERKKMVQYHVVSGRAVDTDALESGTIVALSGDPLNFDVRDSDQIARVNSGIIMEAYTGKNGVVYLINSVLIPPGI